jgi:hypothetical protein
LRRNPMLAGATPKSRGLPMYGNKNAVRDSHCTGDSGQVKGRPESSLGIFDKNFRPARTSLLGTLEAPRCSRASFTGMRGGLPGARSLGKNAPGVSNGFQARAIPPAAETFVPCRHFLLASTSSPVIYRLGLTTHAPGAGRRFSMVEEGWEPRGGRRHNREGGTDPDVYRDHEATA